jgi:HK97 family phage prohead protease
VYVDLNFKSSMGTLNVDEAQGVVECFVAAFGNKDSVGDVVVSGAFASSLRRRKPRVVWGHDWNQPIGKVLEIYEVGPNDPRLPTKMKSAGVGGLFARVQFNLKSERGREAFHSIVFFGEDQEWSIGYKTLDSIYSPERSANMLKEVELYEISPVLHGANNLTATISIKSDNPDDVANKDDKLVESASEKCVDPKVMKLIGQLSDLLSEHGDGNEFDDILASLTDKVGTSDDIDIEPEVQPKLVRRVLALPDAAMDDTAKDGCGCGCEGKGTCAVKSLMGGGTIMLASELSAITSRVVAFYFKTHAAHWNVEGVDFAQYHDMFGEIYTDVHESIDGWAENIRKLGHLAPGSLFAAGAQSPNVSVTSAAALTSELIADNAALIESMKQTCKVADELSEHGVADFIAGRIDTHQKWQWFLTSSVKNAEIKSVLDEIETKAGRVIANRNMARLREALDLIRAVLEDGDPMSLERKNAQFVTEYLVMDVTPESMFAIKSYLDEFAEYHDAEVVVDEDGGEWIAIEAKNDAMMEVVLGFFQGYQDELQIKGFAFGAAEADGDIESKNLPFDYHVKAARRGRRAFQYAQSYDPNARDADNDGRVQDSTAWERPAPPRKPRASGSSGSGRKPPPPPPRKLQTISESSSGGGGRKPPPPPKRQAPSDASDGGGRKPPPPKRYGSLPREQMEQIIERQRLLDSAKPNAGERKPPPPPKRQAASDASIPLTGALSDDPVERFMAEWNAGVQYGNGREKITYNQARDMMKTPVLGAGPGSRKPPPPPKRQANLDAYNVKPPPPPKPARQSTDTPEWAGNAEGYRPGVGNSIEHINRDESNRRGRFQRSVIKANYDATQFTAEIYAPNYPKGNLIEKRTFDSVEDAKDWVHEQETALHQKIAGKWTTPDRPPRSEEPPKPKPPKPPLLGQVRGTDRMRVTPAPPAPSDKPKPPSPFTRSAPGPSDAPPPTDYGDVVDGKPDPKQPPNRPDVNKPGVQPSTEDISDITGSTEDARTDQEYDEISSQLAERYLWPYDGWEGFAMVRPRKSQYDDELIRTSISPDGDEVTTVVVANAYGDSLSLEYVTSSEKWGLIEERSTWDGNVDDFHELLKRALNSNNKHGGKLVEPKGVKTWSAQEPDALVTQRLNGLPTPEQFDRMKKIGGPLGSQGGGWFQDNNGQKYIVKPAKSERHAQNELAAHLLYRAAGVRVDDTGIFERDGKFFIAKRAVQDAEGNLGKIVGNKVNEKIQAQAREGFAIDALASMWDVFGLGGDNVITDRWNYLNRIDLGGGLQFRAQGGDKPSFAPGQPWVEPYSMRTSDQGQSLYGDMIDEEAADALEKLKDFDLDKYDEEMKKAGIDEESRQRIKDTLSDRINNQLPKILDDLRSGDPVEMDGDAPPVNVADENSLTGEARKKEANALLAQFWDDLRNGKTKPKPLSKTNNGEGVRNAPASGFYASEDGSLVVAIENGIGSREITAMVLRQDGKNLDVPDSFVLDANVIDGYERRLDDEALGILEDLFQGGKVHQMRERGSGPLYSMSEMYAKDMKPLNRKKPKVSGTPRLQALNDEFAKISADDTRPWSFAERDGISSEWDELNPDDEANPWSTWLSDGVLTQGDEIDEPMWQQQFENAKTEFRRVAGSDAPDLSKFNREELVEIMERYSKATNPSDATLALLAHYQWLYAKK